MKGLVLGFTQRDFMTFPEEVSHAETQREVAVRGFPPLSKLRWAQREEIREIKGRVCDRLVDLRFGKGGSP